jgi:glutamate synthase domain-containing protein 1
MDKGVSVAPFFVGCVRSQRNVFPVRKEVTMDEWRIGQQREKDISGCGIVGIMNEEGGAFSGEAITAAICTMMERGNGLGAGFAGYGIYPDLKDYWCFHIMYQGEQARKAVEDYMAKRFILKHEGPIPTKRVRTLGLSPLLWRYFFDIKKEVKETAGEEDYIIEHIMEIHRHMEGAFVFSSGKNMGIFKGVGNPDEIAEFYRIPDYSGYLWTAHNRFPTNTPGWWGGAHPFGILDWSVVHNGEISSYGINRKYLEGFGYYCSLSTDTEVMAYLFDLLVRRHGHAFDVVGKIIASSFWSQIERAEDADEQAFLQALRIIYSSALVNGPFAVIVANANYMVGLNDRVKLRPLVAARRGNILYISSEEAAIRFVSKDLDSVWMPTAGEPTIGRLLHGEAKADT